MTVVVVAMAATVDLEKEDVVLVKSQTRGKNFLVPSVLQNTHTRIGQSALGLVYAKYLKIWLLPIELQLVQSINIAKYVLA